MLSPNYTSARRGRPEAGRLSGNFAHPDLTIIKCVKYFIRVSVSVTDANIHRRRIQIEASRRSVTSMRTCPPSSDAHYTIRQQYDNFIPLEGWELHDNHSTLNFDHKRVWIHATASPPPARLTVRPRPRVSCIESSQLSTTHSRPSASPAERRSSHA